MSSKMSPFICPQMKFLVVGCMDVKKETYLFDHDICFKTFDKLFWL